MDNQLSSLPDQITIAKSSKRSGSKRSEGKQRRHRKDDKDKKSHKKKSKRSSQSILLESNTSDTFPQLSLPNNGIIFDLIDSTYLKGSVTSIGNSVPMSSMEQMKLLDSLPNLKTDKGKKRKRIENILPNETDKPIESIGSDRKTEVKRRKVETNKEVVSHGFIGLDTLQINPQEASPSSNLSSSVPSSPPIHSDVITTSIVVPEVAGVCQTTKPNNLDQQNSIEFDCSIIYQLLPQLATLKNNVEACQKRFEHYASHIDDLKPNDKSYCISCDEMISPILGRFNMLNTKMSYISPIIIATTTSNEVISKNSTSSTIDLLPSEPVVSSPVVSSSPAHARVELNIGNVSGPIGGDKSDDKINQSDIANIKGTV